MRGLLAGSWRWREEPIIPWMIAPYHQDVLHTIFCTGHVQIAELYQIVWRGFMHCPPERPRLLCHSGRWEAVNKAPGKQAHALFECVPKGMSFQCSCGRGGTVEAGRRRVHNYTQPQQQIFFSARDLRSPRQDFVYTTVHAQVLGTRVLLQELLLCFGNFGLARPFKV